MHRLVIVVVICALFSYATAGFREDAINIHNWYRAKHHSPPLTLNDALNDYAQKCAERMAYSNNMIHGDKYGENMYMSTDSQMSDSDAAKDATRYWYKGVYNYNYYIPRFSMDTGHFTQIVWKNSENFGIGVARSAEGVHVCANYDPPGNYESQFHQNVLQP